MHGTNMKIPNTDLGENSKVTYSSLYRDMVTICNALAPWKTVIFETESTFVMALLKQET